MKKFWMKRALCLLVTLSLCVGLVPAVAAVETPAAPTNVKWSEDFPGFLTWDAAEGADYYRVEVSLNGEEIWIDSPSSVNYAFAHQYTDMPSGTYTATVTSIARGENGQRVMSDAVASDAFSYTAPDAQMDTPTNLRWDGTTARWDPVEGEDISYRFILYADFGDETWYEMVSTVGPETENDLLYYEMSWMLEEGAQAFAFSVVAISPDITVCRNSYFSDLLLYEEDIGGESGGGGGTEGSSVPVTGIDLNWEDRTVSLGDRYDVSVEFWPTNATNQNYTIVSSNSSVLAIETDTEGYHTIYCAGVGTATVTVTSEDGGYTDSATFTVSVVLPESVTLENGSYEDLGDAIQLLVGDTLDLNADLEPYNTTNDTLVWTISDKTVLSVESRVSDNTHYMTLTALKPGTATISVSCEANPSISDTCTVTVTDLSDVEVAPAKGGLWSDYCADGFRSYDREKRIITIYTAEELALLAAMSREINGYAAYTVKLGSDIDLSYRNWVPGGGGLDSVTFDGDGHTIFGLTVVDSELEAAGFNADSLGLFGNDTDLKVKNLRLRNAKIYGRDVDYAGVIAGKCRSLTNCAILHSTIDIRNSEDGILSSVGGLAGDVSHAMENCRADFGSMVVEGCKAGGLAGQVQTASLCTNNMDMTVRSSYAGGLFWSADGDLRQCTNEAVITAYGSHVGGIAHYFGGDYSHTASMQTCFNRGEITAPGVGDKSCIAGLVSSCNAYGRILSCSNLADLTAEPGGSSAAGIVSDLQGEVLRCKTEGTISADYAAGIAYEVYGTIKGCRSNAELQGDQVGGIAWLVYSDGTVDGCENTLTMEFDGYAVGGIVYRNEGLVNGCVNYGSITAAGHAGGIAYSNIGTVRGCGNYGPIHTTGQWSANAGGIVAELSNYISGASGVVEGCENHAAITSDHDSAGGIAGSVSASWAGEIRIVSCLNGGTVSGGGYTGGILSDAYLSDSGLLTVYQCENTGTVCVTDSGYAAGGIAGNLSAFGAATATPVVLMDVHNDGFVKSEMDSGSSFLGGIVGRAHLENGQWPLENAFNSGTVRPSTKNSGDGALVGHCFMGSSASAEPSYYRKSGSLKAIGYSETAVPNLVGLTSAEMADSAKYSSFDFDAVWEMREYPYLRLEELTAARESGASYYTEISDRLFRIVVPGNTDYPAPSGFTVQSGTTIRHSGGGADVNFPVEGDSNEPIVFSKAGYHTYKMPRKLVQSCNTVTMVPESVTTPFVQSILLKRDYPGGSYSYENLRSGIISVYTMDLMHAADYKGESVYVDVNWNGHEEGSIWLEQNGVRLDLADDVFSTVEMGKYFKPGSGVYVCVGDENGTYTRTLTTLQILERKILLNVELPDMTPVSPHDSGNDKLDFLPGKSMNLSFKDLGDFLDITFQMEEDGTFKGLAGLKFGDGVEKFDAVYKDVDEGRFIFFDEAAAATEEGKKKIDALLENRTAAQSMAKLGIEADCKFLIIFNGRVTEYGELIYDNTTLMLRAKGELGYEYQSAVVIMGATVPTVTYLGAEVEAQFGSTMSLRAGALQLDKEDLEVVVKVNGKYGPGIKNTLTLQATGEGGVRILDLPGWDPESVQFSCVSGIGLGGRMGVFEEEWELFEFPEYVFWRNGEFCWQRAEEGAELQFVPALVSGSYDAAYVSLLNLESTAEPFKSGVSALARPKLAVLEDGTRVMAWLDYDDSRGAADGYGVYYSVCESGVWSEPVLLDDDGTADGSLVMKELGGTVYLAWLDQDQSFGDAYPEENLQAVLMSSDISVARFDPESGTFADQQTFAAPGTMDSRPVLAAVDGGVGLGWLCADAAALERIETEGFGEFRFALYEDEIWSQIWTQEEQPEWYTMEELPADVESIASYLGGAYAYAVGGGTQTVVFPMTGEDGSNGLYACFHDGSGWGEPLLLAELAAEDAVTALSADFDSDGALNVAIAARTRNADGTTGNNARLLTLSCVPKDDLVVTEVDYDRETLIPGAALGLKITVRNESPRQTGAFLMTAEDQAGQHLLQETVYSSLPSGGEGVLEVALPLPEADAWGDLSALSVAVEPMNWKDADETNNTADCDLRLMDVSVEQVYANEGLNAAGETETTVSAWVVNRGLEPLEDVTLTLFGDLDRSAPLGTTTLETLAPGKAALCTIISTDLTGGDCALVEASLKAEENITSNNFDFGTVMALKRPGTLRSNLYDARVENGQLLAEMALENQGQSQQEATMIAAVYQEGRMLQAWTLGSFSVAGESVLTETLELGSVSGNGEVRLYTLSPDGSYAPIGKAVSTDFSA